VHVAPLLKAANVKVRGEVEDEVARTLGRLQSVLDQLDPEQAEAVEAGLRKMGQALGKRFLGAPMARIRSLAQAGELDALEEAGRLLGVEATLLAVRDSEPSPLREEPGARRQGEK
jgi:hypothetical protein